MAKPVLLTVDDDAEVLRAVERDLRRHYADRYRVLRAESGATALEALRGLKKRNDAVSLFLVDQRMPHMTGVEFIGQAMDLYPNAKRVLLTAYADTDAAIRAINDAKIHHYLLKPWDPPEEHLYPALDDLLEDWRASFRPPFDGPRVLGHRWSPDSYAVRDFLARNQVPYRWLDVETAERDAEVRRLAEIVRAETTQLPVVLFTDGSSLANPSATQLAEKLGLRVRAEMAFHDLVIVGGGPAGLAAAVYGASEGLRTVMIEREAPGGQAGMSSRIENYLGFPSGLSGADLARRAVAQARRFGVEILTPQQAVAVRVEGPSRIVKLADGSELGSKALLIATGVSYRKLDVPGADALQGRGVYYGSAMTEAMACRDEDVYIVGGANSAGQAAMYFSKYARRVVMLVRGGSLAASMSQYLIEQIKRTPNIHVETGTRVAEVHGEGRLEAISIHCAESGQSDKVPAASLFVFIGAEPLTDWLRGVVERDQRGFILTGSDLMHDGKRPQGWTLDRDPYLPETNVPGIFAVGDVRHGSVKRVASGVGEGSIAVQFIHQYLSAV
ncbi:MAG: fused response regulator/thioredoxin-disulfide reductase [Acidobacteria bacterium]|nr:MAG: fused response regulator/thioredoxin-disulfide reductase [Acidobacteriota bacterium]